MTVNEEAPPRRPRVRGHFRRSGGPVLIAAIAGIPGGMLNFTNAMAFPSGGIDSCLRVICVATPAYAPPPGVSALVSHNWLRSSYRRALDAAWREGCTSIAIPIMGAGRLGYRTHYAADVACRAVHDFFYGNMHHSPARRARFRRVVFFIEDDPNYIPWLREEAAIIEFERQVMTWA
ncbi:hypothetical protein N431DRAFT_448590 [Stipitochalara longipes BDJ]|nr:hypothetical protein N431DRAFT_448590 [Stipitochalara longipes BDJ]